MCACTAGRRCSTPHPSAECPSGAVANRACCPPSLPAAPLPHPLSPCHAEANKIDAARFGAIHSLARMLEAREAPAAQEAAAAALGNLAANSAEAQSLIASAGGHWGRQGRAAAWGRLGRAGGRICMAALEARRALTGAPPLAGCPPASPPCRRHPAARGRAAQRHGCSQAARGTGHPQPRSVRDACCLRVAMLGVAPLPPLPSTSPHILPPDSALPLQPVATPRTSWPPPPPAASRCWWP